MAFIFGREKTIGRWLRVRPRSFFDWEKTEGVLPPELCDEGVGSNLLLFVERGNVVLSPPAPTISVFSFEFLVFSFSLILPRRTSLRLGLIRPLVETQHSKLTTQNWENGRVVRRRGLENR
ncbi:MAG: hypothetical protein HYY46_14320 [Deltaproteobacteria bacterium]|nr:hypothetical protein [Deltaproteobacteria bacterium]